MVVSLAHIVRRPQPLDAELEGAGDAVGQAEADGADPLAQDLGLGLDDEAVVRAHEVVPVDQHRLPLSRPLGEEPVLVQVGGHDGVGLHVDEVAAAVGLEAQREEGVAVDVPEGPAEEGGAPVEGPPRGVAGALDVGLVGGQGRGDVAVEAGVPVLVVGGRGDPVERGLREAAHVGVAHDLALFERFGLVEVVQGQWALRPFDGFERQCCRMVC